jgi:isoamylase
MSSTLAVGQPYPLGATITAQGVNFALFSSCAERVELCLFDASGTRETARLPLTRTEDIWHGLLPGARAGLLYGYRVHGPYRPKAGLRCNPHKLLLDPHAREIVGRFDWQPEHYGYMNAAPGGDADRASQTAPSEIAPDDPAPDDPAPDQRDNAATALKARVAAALPPPRQAPPQHELRDSVLYELHIKGFTQQLAGVPEPLRGSFAGLAHPVALNHLQRLGVTTVSLLPVHYSVTELRLRQLGLANYWGYNTLGYFALDPRLSATPADPTATRAEFRAMVEALHGAGIEVVLDVVFNHTAEGDQRGPTLSLRGIDNAAYYRLAANDRRRYENWSGCGNTVNVTHPRVTRLVLDSLRYWTSEMGVDGFRFDLAPVLGRTAQDFDPRAPFFTALLQDPVLARVKLLAEPWDLGPQGYQLGHFPARFAEWNDRFRDCLRQFWLHRSAGRGELARRWAASSDRFHHGLRQPSSSVNYVASHDGFTLRDLVSHAHKHNEANGEGNRDGSNANHSINAGAEGDIDDPAILAQRLRLQRALLACALLAQGTPMLQAGDELGRSQRGNNNAYCQDNALSWIDWTQADAHLIDFTAAVIALRRALPALRQDHWLDDHPQDDGRREVQWLAPARAGDSTCRPMTLDDWHDVHDTHCHALALWLAPRAAVAVLVLINADPTPATFVLPPGHWTQHIDSAQGDTAARSTERSTIEVPAHGLLVLSQEPD